MLGAFIPAGVDITRGQVGLFLTAIDLGTVTNLRFDGSDTTAPNVSFDQVLSPGVFARWAPFDSPFVIGGGLSLVPGLRGDPAQDAVRYHGFIAIDVTLLPLL
jgi:hypothetical protein